MWLKSDIFKKLNSNGNGAMICENENCLNIKKMYVSTAWVELDIDR